MFINIAIIFVKFFLVDCQSNVAGTCQTPTNEIGSCISIKNCTIHKQILDHVLTTRRNFLETELDYIRQSYCGVKGTEHLVCCSYRHNELLTNQVKNPTEFSQLPQPSGHISRNTNIEQHPNLKLLPKFSICGINPGFNSDRISQGNETELMEYPWMALLRYRTFDKELIFRCAGTLISKRYILSAAHCLQNTESNLLLYVRLGENNLKNEKDCEEDEDGETFCAPPVQDIGIENIIVHPNFIKDKNDIALLRLKFEANINNQSVVPICLPITTQLQNSNNKKLEVAGWGLTEKGVSFEKLFKALMSVTTINTCENAYKRQFTREQTCIHGDQGVNNCKGDSGGPAMNLIRSGNFFRVVQFGIISGGNSRCDDQESYPAILTNVSPFMQWILDNLKP